MELVSGWGPVPALALVSALLPRFTRGSVIVTRAVPFARTMKLFMSPACGPIGLRNPSCLPAGLKCGPALSECRSFALGILVNMNRMFAGRQVFVPALIL